MKQSRTFEVQFAIGSREGYHGPSFTKTQLMGAIGDFQQSYAQPIPVKVTDCAFVMKDYREDGWDISCICYPNSPQGPKQVKEFMYALAEHLLYHFKQNRITVRVFPSWIPSDENHGFPSTEMFEIEDAQRTHTK